MASLLSVAERQKLVWNFQRLKAKMEPDDVVDMLYASDVLSESALENINACRTRGEKAEMLVQTMLRKDSDAYLVFIDSLNATGQHDLAACLNVDAPQIKSPEPQGSDVDGPRLLSQPIAVVSDERDAREAPDDSGDESPSEALEWSTASAVLAVNVRPCVRASITQHRSEFVYGMTHPVRGRALIMCNSSFSKETQLSRRLGADNDVVNMATLLQKLGFLVEQCRDMSRDEMFALLDRERRRPEHASYGAFVIYISSHGDSNAVFGVDGKQLLLGNVYDLFDSYGCPPLAGKPKLVIVEASRGPRFDRGSVALHLESDGDVQLRDGQTMRREHTSDSCRYETHDAQALGDSGMSRQSTSQGCSVCSSESQLNFARQLTATKADFIIAFSTFTGYTSLRSPEHGCWFSRAIVEVFSKHACKEHVADLLKRVRRKMARVVTKLGYMQVGVTTDTLTKDMYLFPRTDPG